MGDVTLADFLTLLCDELAATAAGTARVMVPGDTTAAVRMALGDVDVELPVRFRVTQDPVEPARLLVSLPSLRETAPGGRLGRLRLHAGPRYEAPSP
jgi:hypothetical protein